MKKTLYDIEDGDLKAFKRERKSGWYMNLPVSEGAPPIIYEDLYEDFKEAQAELLRRKKEEMDYLKREIQYLQNATAKSVTFYPDPYN